MATRVQQGLERMFSAVAFAEAGEFAAARQILGTERQVLLALRDDRLDERALHCALNLCQRVNAGLDILLVSATTTLPAQLAQFFGEVRRAGVGYRFVRGDGAFGREIMHYVKTCRSVAFVVIESLESWSDDRRGEPWRTLGCPLVVAADNRAGVAV
jgi:hypothetical protein